MEMIGMAGVRAVGDRIGVWLDHGGPGGKALWVEIDPNGKEIGRWPAVAQLPRVLLSDGSVYAQGNDGVKVLNHASGQWNPVFVPFDGVLIGSDGSSLVFFFRGTNMVRWFNP
jgi:hypothetical protein